jgi:1-phosphofructokinase family hexose kinase
LLNPAIDVIYNIDRFEPGNTRTDVASEILPAGKGINVAKAVRELGEKACVVALMPQDDKPRFERYLEKQGIKTLFYPVEGAVRISCTIVDSAKESSVTHLSSEGMRFPARFQDEFLTFCTKHMKEGDSWVLAGSIPPGFDADVYKKIISICASKSITVLLDSRGKALKVGVRAQPAMIKPNLSELEAFFNEQIQGVHHIALKGKRFIDMGISYVFISLGSDGMIALHENECLLCSAPDVDVVDTVGCGDALDAGIMVGHVRKFSFTEMCRMAVACGTSNAGHIGAGNISREEVWRLMEEVKIEAV